VDDFNSFHRSSEHPCHVQKQQFQWPEEAIDLHFRQPAVISGMNISASVPGCVESWASWLAFSGLDFVLRNSHPLALASRPEVDVRPVYYGLACGSIFRGCTLTHWNIETVVVLID
jgi:hypothetical protein